MKQKITNLGYIQFRYIDQPNGLIRVEVIDNHGFGKIVTTFYLGQDARKNHGFISDEILRFRMKKLGYEYIHASVLLGSKD